TITKAMQNALGDTIKVAAGNYAEGIITTGYAVLRGGYAGDFLESSRIPAVNQTVLEAVSSTMWYDAFGVKVDGFVFDGKTNVAGTGLHLLGPAVITHSVIKNVKNSSGYGIRVEANVSVINNTIYNNTHGVYLSSGASSVVKNNIIRGNNFGLNNSAGPSVGSYNDYFNNSFNYTGTFTSPGTGDLALDPLNINAAGGNFQLTSGSPCINAGDPAVQYNDPDGSRNDIGAYRFQNFPPGAPQNLTATAGNTQITLRWKKNSESDFLRYRIYSGNSSNPTVQTDSTTGGINDTLKVISGLINGTTYYLRITAVDSAGNQSGYSNEVNAAPLFDPPPSAPQNLSAVAGNGQVTLLWRKNTETDFLRYRIYRSTSPNASLQVDSSLSDASDTTKIMGGLTNGTTYYFRVTAIDTAKNISSYSNEVSATPFVLPSAPSSLTASAVSSTRIDLNWNAGTNATKYRIFRSLTSGTGFSQIDSVNSPTVAYNNTGLTELTAYFYYVVGVNAFGISSSSNEATATTLAVPASIGVPDISNTNPAPATNITISTQVTGTSPVVKLFFGKPHQSQGDSLTMAFGAGTYSATIPFSAVTQEGLWFRIRAQNSGGVTYYPVSGTQAISVQIADIATMISWSAFPEGLEADAYSTIAWSLNGTLNLPFYLGEQEFKDGGPSNWRALSFDASTQTFSDVTDISSGNAYYFYHHGGGKEDLFSRGVNPSAISTNVFNEWVLKSGWNLVPWPYSFGAAISNRDQSKIGRVWLRNGKNGWEESTELKPFTGYMIYNKTAGDLVLGNVLSWSLSAGKSQASEFVWSAQFQAVAGDYKDAFNVIGVSALSSDEWDDLDERAPISVGQGVNVYFQSSGKMLAYDIRDANIGHEWNMAVENSTKNDKTILQWDVANLPQQFNLILYDITHNKKINALDASSGYEFRNDRPTSFKVFAGSADWVEQNVQQLEKELPQTFALHQNYPNPFNPTTRIAFDVAQSGNVKIKIYNVLGQEVATVVNRYYETGRYNIEWNGRDDMGRQLSSGVYIYRLETGKVSRVKKMLLVK
ncbi:fibronectin type III domain-containing protein, partial [bacterium]|nr:fibronectin type III domain-containing protein [bacterium]